MPRAAVILVVLSVGLALAALGGQAADAQQRRFIQGKFLVASPAMPDPRFARTVILMVEHNDRGAHGFVVNRVLGRKPLAAILGAMGRNTAGIKGNIAVRWGGPVGRSSAAVIHSAEYHEAHSKTIAGGYKISRNPRVLDDIGRGKGPKKFIFLSGYAGWGPGQLERELGTGHWVVVPADPALVFAQNPRTIWTRAYRNRRIDL